MASEVLLPRQGQSVESCLILSWKKNVGDPVAEGEILCEVETDKATFEVESTASGVLLARLAEEGDDVPVLTPIAVVGQPGERVETAGSDAAAGAKPAVEAADAPRSVKSGSGTASEENGAQPAAERPETEGTTAGPGAPTGGASVTALEHRGVSPRARRLAEEKNFPTDALSGTGPGGRVIERDVKRALAEGAQLTPAAREAAARTGSKAPAEGTGIGGRVTAEDVARAAAGSGGTVAGEQAAAEAAAVVRPAVHAAPGAITEEPVRGMRKLIAERMRASLASTAQLTINAGADARKLLEYRRRLKAAPEEYGVGGITINDLVLYAVSRTLPLFPVLNALFTGEKILKYEDVHLGFAVDTPRGLVVPVIRNADRLSLTALAAEAKRLAAACQSGKIDPEELSGGTFTVTNLGSLGIESFTPVLNPPQVGILGVCSIVPKPTVKDDGGHELVPTLGLSLTIDHQVVDGAPGAKFLKKLADAIANLDVILAR